MRASLPHGRLFAAVLFALLLLVIATAPVSQAFGDGSRSRADGQLVDGDPIHGRHQPPDTFATRTEGEWITLVPPGREGHAMVMDEARRQVVIVGGISYGAVWGDAWAIGVGAPATAQRILGNWSERFGPEGSLVLDTRRDRIIRYGGTRTGVVDGPPGTWRGDDPYVVGASLAGDGAWAQLVPTYVPGVELPRPRHGHVAIDDATRDRMVVFGGSSWDDVYGSLGIQHPNDDLWALTLADPPRWSRVAETGDVPHHALGSAALDAAHDRMWYVADGLLWRMDLATAAWDSIPVSGPLPPHDATVALDPAAMRLYAHRAGNLWSMDLRSPGTWQALSVGGEPPFGNGPIVWDAGSRTLFAYSGRRGEFTDQDPHAPAILWGVEMVSAAPHWRRVYDGRVPGTILQRGVYDGRRDRLIAYGLGQPGSGLWELRHGQTQWRSMPGSVAPGGEIVLDEANDRLVRMAFDPGGLTTIAYDMASPSPQWTVAADPDPGEWFSAVMGYDAGRQRVVRMTWRQVITGQGVEYPLTMEWLNGDTWRAIPIAESSDTPWPQQGAILSSDPESGRMFYAGLQQDIYGTGWVPSDLWAVELGDSARWSRRSTVVDAAAYENLPPLAFDALRHQVVYYQLYGGCCGWRTEGEVYSVSSEQPLSFALPHTWLELFSPKNRLPGLVYDGRNDRMIAFGGSAYEDDHVDTLYYAASLAVQKPLRVVRVDVHPGAGTDVVKPGTHATVQVGVLSDPTFDARQIDVGSIRVAGVPVRRDGGGRPVYSVRDVDGDGLDDIVIHFDAHDLPLTEADTAVKLWGQTFDDVRIEGTTSVVVHTPGRQGGASQRAAAPDAPTFAIALAADGAGFECRLALLPNARVELFDVTGRRIASAVAAGGAVQTLSLMPASRPAPGLYFARLTGPATLTRKVVVLR